MEKNTQVVHILSCCIWRSLPAKDHRKTSKQVHVACGIDPGVKVGLERLVSCIGGSLCSNKIAFRGSSFRVHSVGFCPSSVWAQGFVPAWCVLCTLQTVVCRSGLCVSFLGKVKYLF